jgi:capsular polysaccharide biosynthesis protein
MVSLVNQNKIIIIIIIMRFLIVEFMISFEISKPELINCTLFANVQVMQNVSLAFWF